MDDSVSLSVLSSDSVPSRCRMDEVKDFRSNDSVLNFFVSIWTYTFPAADSLTGRWWFMMTGISLSARTTTSLKTSGLLMAHRACLSSPPSVSFRCAAERNASTTCLAALRECFSAIAFRHEATMARVSSLLCSASRSAALVFFRFFFCGSSPSNSSSPALSSSTSARSALSSKSRTSGSFSWRNLKNSGSLSARASIVSLLMPSSSSSLAPSSSSSSSSSPSPAAGCAVTETEESSLASASCLAGSPRLRLRGVLFFPSPSLLSMMSNSPMKNSSTLISLSFFSLTALGFLRSPSSPSLEPLKNSASLERFVLFFSCI
ncbi:hypothetical protein G6O67_007488 [Ophiocordyceps sinensis]|uniref:Uncharacterized protein n=1 Tax=Ophiocordyceps sinensis TaxID=72228 RepID=A0A8H4PL53_9HYPO|nr:hypothetical protein G6O67_007488 [Ophiocordyceps sinensis]